MGVEYIIRIAGEKDMEQIADLYVRNWRETYRGLLCQDYLDNLDAGRKQREWSDYIKSPLQGIFVAVQDEKVLGFAAFKPYHRVEDCIYLDSLHVEKNCRGRGIGTALIASVNRQGISRQYGKMGVCVVRGNDDARKLYIKLGAKHYKDKEDDFTGVLSYSEILLWDPLHELNIK